MKRVLLTAVVVLSLSGLVASASAGQKQRQRDGNNSNSGNYGQNSHSHSPAKRNSLQKSPQSQPQNSHNIRPSWKTKGDVFGASNGNHEPRKHGSKHQQPMQLDPGRPDGRVPTPDVATPVRPLPVSRPGYVLVNGHWERAKPGSVTTPIPTTASVEIRDHRAVDPRPHSGGRPGGYRPSTPSGSTVTDSPPRDLTGQTVYGEGPGLHSLWPIHGFKTRDSDHRDVKVPYTRSTLPPPPSVRPAGK